MEICSFCRLTLLSSRLQSFLHEATSEACEYYFTMSCWGMDLYLCLKWDTVRRHFQSLSERRAPRQSSLSTNWSNPLGFVYLNETLRPRGVCWEKVRNAKYLFFGGSSSAFVLPFFFSLSQPFSFMIQKSLVNIPARQLYWASQRPPLRTELSGSHHSFCNAQLFTHWSFPQNHLFWLLYYLFSTI